ncbi:MAG: alanine racemase [Arhodomonas sp.]|nr:alanine racemase [Arhodomonas sp.]
MTRHRPGDDPRSAPCAKTSRSSAGIAAPARRAMAVLKADAYGHGLLKVAEALAEADGLAVSCLGEAQPLRRGGLSRIAIVLLEGFFDADEIAAIVAERRLDAGLFMPRGRLGSVWTIGRAGGGPCDVWMQGGYRHAPARFPAGGRGRRVPTPQRSAGRGRDSLYDPPCLRRRPR